MLNFNTWGPATVLIVLVSVIVVGVGGAVVILQPETLTFRQYLDDLQKLAFAIAGLGGARAIMAHAQAKTLTVPPQPDQGDAGKPSA